MRENGYMYMYGWVPLLFTFNYHNIVKKKKMPACLLWVFFFFFGLFTFIFRSTFYLEFTFVNCVMLEIMIQYFL